MGDKKIYNPSNCDNEACNKSFKKGDIAIKHNDIHAIWFFCCEKCYQAWLKEYKVKTTITIGQDVIEEDLEEN